MCDGRPGDVLRVPNTTASTSVSTGALVVSGGVGVGGDLHARAIHADSVTEHSSFTIPPTCSVFPLDGDHLATKGYVDQLVSMGLSWKQSVRAFHDFAGGNPVGTAEGSRYISMTTAGTFTKDYIYEWANSKWVEYATQEGWACYVDGDTSPLFANQAIIYSTAGQWVSLGGVMTHSALLGLGSDDHPQYAMVNGRSGDVLRVTNTT
jgi:hypothetical protein